MVIGGIKCPQQDRKKICKEIMGVKIKNGISPFAEIKWNKVSNCNIEYFKQLIDYFFDNEELEFRSVIVDKTKLRHEEFSQTHNEFYYKMYFHCLSGLISTKDENYIYLDRKDTKGTYRIQQLHYFLTKKTHDFDQSKIKRIQCVNSVELPILQLTDLLIGAIGYHNRDLNIRSKAKVELVKHIQDRCGYSL